MNHPTQDQFFIAGGTLPLSAPSYIKRQADETLYSSLLRGEFCYILTSRQMGKSSLMARTATRLREADVAVAVLDLTSIGQELSREQWYYSLLMSIGQRLNLKDGPNLREELRTFWREEDHLSPVQRWTEALHHILRQLGERPLVIFIDEIDTVLALSFPRDEFFAAIRACYNRRPEDPDFNRLTFCLLGVANPSDLIQDTRLTPFNVGRRIELYDFTDEAAVPLASGLAREEIIGQVLLERVLYWTGGHPYLTQRLCRAIVENPATALPEQVDALCETLFLSSRAQEQDDNLTFVRDRLLKSRENKPQNEKELASLLDLYGRVCSGRRVPDDKSNTIVSVLRLSGVVRSIEGNLRVRNRIYARVFDRAWITAHMPGAELRRQRAAYRRGLFRAAAVASAILAVVAALGLVAVSQARRAAKADADRARDAKDKAVQIARHKYAYGILGSQKYLQDQSLYMAVRLLEKERPTPEEPTDLRGFVWRYLWQRCQEDRSFFFAPRRLFFTVAVSPNGRIIAAGGQDASDQGKTVTLWDTVSHQEIATLTYSNEVRCLAFSPNGKLLAVGGGTAFDTEQPAAVRLWKIMTSPDGRILLRELASLNGHQGEVMALAFSPDSKMLVTGSADKTVRLWDVASHRMVDALPKSLGGIDCLAFNGEYLAFGVGLGRVSLWNVHKRRLLHTLPAHSAHDGVYSAAFSPDGRTLATGGFDRMVRLWDIRTGRRKGMLPHPREVHSVAFSPDGKTLATGCWDDIVRLWDVASHRKPRELIGHVSRVNSVVFAPNGKTLVTGGNDGTVRVWDVDPKHSLTEAIGKGDPILGIALSRDNRMLATAGQDKMVRLWDVSTGRRLGVLKGHTAAIYSVAFSPDGKMLASGSDDGTDGTARLWDVATRRQLAGLHTGRTQNVAFSGDGKVLAAGGRPVTLWDTASYRQIGSLKRYMVAGSRIAVSPDGDTLAVAGPDVQHKEYGDGTVELWSLQTQRPLAAIRGAHINNINALAFSPDGKTLATGGWDRSVLLWDVTKLHGVVDGRKQKPIALRDFAGQVNSIAFLPDGNLVVGNEDHTVKIWNRATQDETAVLSGHKDEVSGVAFSSDGDLLISGSLDGTVRLWRAAPFARTDDPERVRFGNSLK